MGKSRSSPDPEIERFLFDGRVFKDDMALLYSTGGGLPLGMRCC